MAFLFDELLAFSRSCELPSLAVNFQDPQVIEGLGNHMNVGIAEYSSYLPVLTN